MKKAEILKALEGQGDTSDFILRSQDEENTFLENYSKGKIDTAISEVHKRYDEDLFKLTGKHKDGSEKTYDFNKRVLSEYIGKVQDFETQISTLKEQVKNSGGDKHLKTELESVQKQFKEYKEEREAEKAQYEKKYQKTLIRAEITKALGEFKLKTMDEDVRKVFLDKVVDDLVSTAEFRDDALVFLDSEQKVLRNKNNSLNPYSPKEILSEKLKSIVDAERRVEGVDFSKAIEKDKDGKFKVNVTRPDAVKTKTQVSEWLVKDGGFKRNTPEYMAAYAELSKDLPMS
jgi:hypothetical protein